MPFIRDIMRLAIEETRFDGFPALRLMGFGKTAARSAASRFVSLAADFLKWN
jgi:hypothetical protein